MAAVGATVGCGKGKVGAVVVAGVGRAKGEGAFGAGAVD